MKLELAAAHPAAAPDRADGGRRKEQECERREELNYPTSEVDLKERTARTKRKSRGKRERVKIRRVLGKEHCTYSMN